MNSKTSLSQFGRRSPGVSLVGFAVAFNGLLLVASTLREQLLLHGRFHLGDVQVGVPLIAGVTLLYLSSSLLRQKQTAWVLTLGVYVFIIGEAITELFAPDVPQHVFFARVLRGLVLPVVVLLGLLLTQRYFSVKSDLQTFRQSLRLVIVVLLVAFLYGVGGFLLMDKHDFHQEIGLPQAIHRTIDQFGLTTKQLHPYTRRAKLFLGSLSVISVAAVAYALISLFQPLKARITDQAHNRETIQTLLEAYPATSEDFFKLWPHDKLYFLNDQRTAGLALHVYRGVALVVGDPAGEERAFGDLLNRFGGLCHGNDWTPAFIHTEARLNHFYEQRGFAVQKIGEEAVLNLEHFHSRVASNKYFRHIRNKFDKLGYTLEVLEPPHSAALIERLSHISHDWLSRPGRDERGFMMGYFTAEYMQQCTLMVTRDAAGTIQAFVNQIPSYDAHEANFDLLRHMGTAPTNLNDYLLVHFAEHLHNLGFERLNLGLCPLVGLDKKEKDENDSVIDTALRFAYANGDRFYSFSGLQRFKSKYEPMWSDRFIVYRGGIRGFTRTLNALNRAMKVKVK